MSGEKYALDWLRSKGYAPHAAAAIVGHGIQESGLKPNGAVGDNGTAFGMFQWRGPRAQALQQYAGQRGLDWKTMDAQLSFLDHELNTTEKRAGDALRGAADVRGATRAMMDFERPAGYTPANPEAGHGWDNRLGNAFRLAGVTPDKSVGDIMPAVGVAGMPAAPMAGATPGSIAMQFLQQTEADAKVKKEQTEAEAVRRNALFSAPPAAPGGGLGGMFG